MIFKQLKILNHNNKYDISIKGSKILSIVKSDSSDALQSPFSNTIAFPGLINSHDHLDFNLFPKLGTGNYNNYIEWGSLLHREYKYEIEEIINIPQCLRIKWGIYKNLLCGVTSVSNHGKKITVLNSPLNIINEGQCLHSVAFEKNWKWKLNNPFRMRSKCIIHSGEGIDQISSDEITILANHNFFKRELIGIHGVSMNADQSDHFSALVWCPQSNYFLFNKTADIKELKKSVRIIFGTDSTLTSDWNIWEHLRTARTTGSLNDSELFDSVTSTPSDCWKLNSGRLMPDKNADLVISRIIRPDNDYDSFYSINPENLLLVMVKGKIWMYDLEIRDIICQMDTSHTKWNRIKINNEIKMVPEELVTTVKEIKAYNANLRFPFDLI